MHKRDPLTLVSSIIKEGGYKKPEIWLKIGTVFHVEKEYQPEHAFLRNWIMKLDSF